MGYPPIQLGTLETAVLDGRLAVSVYSGALMRWIVGVFVCLAFLASSGRANAADVRKEAADREASPCLRRGREADLMIQVEATR